MNNNGVEMNVVVVRGYAKQFDTIGDTLQDICNVLETISTALKAVSFIGGPGAAAAAQFIDRFKPPLEQMAEQCHEISRDLLTSAQAFEDGDMEGANLFATKASWA